MHLITDNLSRSLKGVRKSCSVPIGGINNTCTFANHSFTLTFKSICNTFEKSLEFLVVPKIAEFIPDEPFPRELVNIPKNIRLADPQFHSPRLVELLIGSGATLSMLSIGQINLSPDDSDLILQKTRLGWIIAGGVGQGRSKGAFNCKLADLTSVLERFWKIEDSDGRVSTKEIVLDSEKSEYHFLQNTVRQSDGRYMVRLPFREDSVSLGVSKPQAFRRFHALQKRLDSDSNLKFEYHKVIQDYLDLGHMTPVYDERDPGYYMPHHPVVKQSSSTTKVRVVFDASAKTSSGTSLNQSLLVGPTIQRTLFEHLIAFRIHKYVLSADICQMYRQVLIHPSDRKYQRILWYKNDRIQTFELNTVTFGVSAAPFLAIRTLHQLAEDEKANFRLACSVLLKNFLCR